MRNVKLISLVLLGSFIMTLPIYTYAKTITNLNGIEMSEEEYNNFLKIHTDEYIMTMDENDYEKLKDLDYSTVKEKTIYVETTYNSRLGLLSEREITEEQYNSINPDISTIVYDKGGYSETTAKKLTLDFVTGSYYHYVTATATWKQLPSMRSFDVLGIRVYGFNVRNGSQSGEQIYKENGTIKTISYGWNGANTKILSNGYGTSMNLVNNTITALQVTTTCDVTEESDRPAVYASYQHAVKDVTLEESQNYTLGGAGLGGVFVYPYSISSKYDGMTGTGLQF